MAGREGDPQDFTALIDPPRKEVHQRDDGMRRLAGIMAAAVWAIAAVPAHAAEPKVAVTDLTYEEKVSQYFRAVSAQSKTAIRARDSERETPSTYSARSSLDARQETRYAEFEGYYTYIDRGELRNYTTDLKGLMLQEGGIRLVQGRPYQGSPTEKIFDIISRIKQGYYPGADYVLFGTVSSIQFRQEVMPLSYGSGGTATLSLELVADFSLINTKTYEIKAAFSAMGSGQDTKILTRPGDRVVMNRAKVITETSKSLADAAYAELAAQLGLRVPDRLLGQPSAGGKPLPVERVEPVKVY